MNNTSLFETKASLLERVRAETEAAYERNAEAAHFAAVEILGHEVWIWSRLTVTELRALAIRMPKVV